MANPFLFENREEGEFFESDTPLVLRYDDQGVAVYG